jgi:hypothetical protein
MVESERFLSVQWDSIPPSECGKCDGLQGAMLNIAQSYTYPEPPPACEEQTVFPKCVSFMFTFYQLRSNSYVFKEASHVKLVKQELISSLKDCGGGGKTSAVTAIAQLLFWKQTAEEFRTIGKPFLLDPGPKTIAADPSLCEDGEPPDEPPPPRPGLPGFPEFTIDRVDPYRSLQAFYETTVVAAGGTRVSLVQGAIISFPPLSVTSTTSLTSSYNSVCKSTNPSLSGRITYRENGTSNVSFINPFAYSSIGPVNVNGVTQRCALTKATSRAFIRLYSTDGSTRDVDIGYFDVDATVDPQPNPPPPPPPPPPEERGILFREELVLSVFSAGEYGDFDAFSAISVRVKDSTTCSEKLPPKPTLTELSNFFGTAYRIIGFDQKITILGRCAL